MGKILVTIILFCICISIISTSTIPNENDRAFEDRVDKLSTLLEKFDALQLLSLDKQLSSITGSLSQVDANIRSLHEKSGTWSIFLHHVQAWTDSMKAIDHKVDLIKLAQDETDNLENKLNSMEFSLNHILAKIDALNEKSRNVGPVLLEKVDSIYKMVQTKDQMDKIDKKDVDRKLNAIMRHVLTLDYSRNRESRRAKMSRGTQSEVEFYNQNFETIEDKLDRILDLLSIVNDLEEMMRIQEKNSDILNNVQELVKAIDERTVRLYDAEAQHSSKLLSCCRQSSDELATFTGSSDLLLKKIEKFVSDVKGQVRRNPAKVNESSDNDAEKPKTEEENEKPGSSNWGNDTIEKDSSRHEDEAKYHPSNSSPDESGGNSDEKREEDHKKEDLPKVSPDENSVGDRDHRESEEVEEEVTETVKQTVRDAPKQIGCHELEERTDGIYRFKNSSSTEMRNFYERYCAFPTDGLGWTVIQRRGPYEIQERFNRTWDDYRQGFGDLHRDFWFGNEFIYRLVNKDIHELRIEMEDFNGVEVWAEYSIFQIESEKHNYKLMLGGFRGSVTDSLLYSDGMEFSTYDQQHDRTSRTKCCSCAAGYGSGWWFDNCAEANLNGIYRDKAEGHNYIGVIWEKWHGDYSMKKTRMLIRPRNIWRDEDDAGEDVFSNIPSDP